MDLRSTRTEGQAHELQARAASSPPYASIGAVDFASPEAQEQRTAELMGAGAMVVHVPPLPASMRGRLAQHIDECIERDLAERGLPSPWLADWSAMPRDAAARLADQLFRARNLGSSALAIALGAVTTTDEPVTPEDSATLVMLAQTCAVAPLVLLLDDADLNARGYAAPVPLSALLSPARSTLPPASSSAPPPMDFVPISVSPLQLMAIAEEMDAAERAASDAPAEVADDTEREDEAAHALAEKADADAREKAEKQARAEAEAKARVERATVGIPVSGPSDAWRSWSVALGAVRGPLPLSAFEKLFVESYGPLTAAIEEGLDDPRALRAHEEFRRAFERAYTDAFATFGASGRRPRLVMDLYDFAAKQARLHNARSSHVLIVDSMRWDLGLMVRDAFQTATLTAETIMFSSLPTNTLRQLETLARGIDALRDPTVGDMVESLRGRSADTVRRMRVGSRELYKLDTVPAMLETAAAFDEMAEHVTRALVRHVETLAPRTLLVVAGDHGFTVDRNGRATHGGASPEEVMVPAFAYLVGDLH